MAGYCLDIGVHALDLLSWWWGHPDEIVYEDDAMGGVEANCHIRFAFFPRLPRGSPTEPGLAAAEAII